ncbi:MAG: rhodanese-like domain-containing protein [Bacteroidetes bacterium]|nr:rhodanese-like domain-containing protein [Bacteroidota bacterium]
MLNLFKTLFQNAAYENLPPTDFWVQLKATPDAVLLDVRTPSEVAAGKLDGAKNIDFQHPSFMANLSKLDKEKTYFVYCRSGVRSANACRKMHEMGFTNLVNLAGGYISL